MVLHNPNNWHWVNKDAREWAQKYFNDKLTVLSASQGVVSAKIDKVLSVEGDVDVSQRKGKVITLFDVKLRLEFSGKTPSGDDVSGSITVPEVAHDTQEDEYVFEVDVYSDNKEKQAVRDLVRGQLLPQLRKALSLFSGDLIIEHGKDIQHSADSKPAVASSSLHTPAPGSSKTEQGKATPSSSPLVNTVTLTDGIEFQTSAEQLYSVFVDPQRVAAFTRSPPQNFDPSEGGRFSLFGGNVEGVFKVLEKNKKIVQSWRLGGWPKGHYSTLTLVFDQGSNSTTLRLTWDGVPVGEEEVTKRNFGEYYVKSIKQTFGYSTSLPRLSSFPAKHKNFVPSFPPSSVVKPDSSLLFGMKILALVCVPIFAALLVPVAKQAMGV
ncbi:Co-chaperone [Maublancomyces gigas]|uniref:Co-chaperone n=1 Tax=Discina gigas TaxID=1032678 RepID=A0ABR3GCT9_9PEZI